MQPELKPFWDLAESLKSDILARVESRAEGSRRRAIRPGDWSPLQVVAHLVVTEKFVIGSGENPTGRPANPVVIQVLCAALRAGIPMPAPDVTDPGLTPETLGTLARRWDTLREVFHERLASAAPDAPFGTHPYFGVVTMRQTVEMLAAHLTYHVKRFPASVEPGL